MGLLVKMVEYSLERCLCYFAMSPKRIIFLLVSHEDNMLSENISKNEVCKPYKISE